MDHHQEQPAPSLAKMTTPATAGGKTLAQAVQQFREKRDLTPHGLAKRSGLPLAEIEDIEAGITLFLSVTTRQRLAKVFRVLPQQIAQYEMPSPNQPFGHLLAPEGSYEAEASYKHQVERLTRNPEVALVENATVCPKCHKGALERRTDRRMDMNQHVLTIVRIHCTECLFRTQVETLV